MFEKASALRERLEKESGETVSALDLEKVAYVLAKEAKPGSKRYDIEEDGGEEEEEGKGKRGMTKSKGIASEDGSAKVESMQRPHAKRRRKGSADAADED